MTDSSDRTEIAETPGVLGDGLLHPGKANMRLVKRAIKSGWPIDAETRQLVKEQMEIVVQFSKSDRNKTAAAKVLVAADALNIQLQKMDQADEHLESGLKGPRINVNVGVKADGPVQIYLPDNGRDKLTDG